jgi:hypothetical protein
MAFLAKRGCMEILEGSDGETAAGDVDIDR